VNILGEDGEALCQLFAMKGADRFASTPWRVGVSGAPVLEEAIAYLDCRFEAEYPGGDHKIIVGRVLDLDVREGARPLLFYKGGYQRMHEA
jgi:flavin reductase (DIM6/NTAB) family NADH-FMN oxidoreductase RutF